MTKFSHCHDHHVAKHGFDCDLFTSDSRPHCIQDHYVLSETSPSKIMRGADMYRKDGLCTSRLFKLWPVALNEPKISSPDFNLPRRVRVYNLHPWEASPPLPSHRIPSQLYKSHREKTLLIIFHGAEYIGFQRIVNARMSNKRYVFSICCKTDQQIY